MPALLQHLAKKGYGYIDTHVDRARNRVPLLDASVKRFEPYVLPTIVTVDKYVDVVCTAAEVQVLSLHEKHLALKGMVSGLGLAATGRFYALSFGMHATAVDLVDRADTFVDQLLPPNESEKNADQQLCRSNADAPTPALIPRTFSIVFRIPVRSTRIVVFNISSFAEMFSNKVVRVSQPGVTALQSSRHAVSQKMAILWQCAVDGKSKDEIELESAIADAEKLEFPGLELQCAKDTLREADAELQAAIADAELQALTVLRAARSSNNKDVVVLEKAIATAVELGISGPEIQAAQTSATLKAAIETHHVSVLTPAISNAEKLKLPADEVKVAKEALQAAMRNVENVKEADCTPQGHPMETFVSLHGGTCDSCSGKISRGTKVLDCRLCNWYLCPNCLPSHPGVQWL